MRYTFVVAALLLCSPGAHAQYQIEPAFPNLRFTRPVDFQHPGDGSGRLFVVEQSGRISVFDNNPAASTKSTFLDIRSRVNSGGGEEGLLGLAFHPQYAQNRFFYVYYSASGGNNCAATGRSRCSRVARFEASTSDPNTARASTESVVLEIGQPFSNHNGGQIRFGPDGYLYIGLGDGGSGGDPQGHGQNRNTLLGSILRIDVDNPMGALAYGIPPDNPFVGSQFREEIYSYGFRNPWRFSFDAETHDLWVGDVGQNSLEEVDIVTKGGNYGWNVMEGNRCFSPSSGCQQMGLELPVWSYGRGSSGGRAVTGGFVYRGTDMAPLIGTYVYGDYVSGRIWGLSRQEDGTYTNALLVATELSIASFGADENNELYICASDGNIYKLRSTSSSGSTTETPGSTATLEQSFPNPASSISTVRFTLSSAGSVSLKLFNPMGQLVATLVDRFVSAGQHKATVPVTELAPGTYFIRLRTSSTAEMQKMVVF